MKKLVVFGLCIVLGLQLSVAALQYSVPPEILGNWINKSNNEWEYGFFEDFAIARSGFWNYKTIGEGKKQVVLTLDNGREELRLKIRKADGAVKTIAADGHASEAYRSWDKEFLPYPAPDTTAFPAPRYEMDTVTLYGYLRHAEWYEKKNFEVSFGKITSGGQEELTVNFDSLGRFCMKIPVCTPQLVFLDWGRLLRRIVVTPGETIMMYVDVKDLISTEQDKRDRKYAFQRDRDILFMGENARLHNEFTHCPYPWMRDMYTLKDIAKSDMDYLQLVRSDYDGYQREFAVVKQKYPTLSRRCLEAVEAGVKYEMASTLMQKRFYLSRKNENAFDDPAYMAFVDQNFSLDSVAYYFMTRDYSSFVRDYTGYVEDQTYVLYDGRRCKFVEGQEPEALRMLCEQGKFTQLTTGEVDRFREIESLFNKALPKSDTLTIQALYPERMKLLEKIQPLLDNQELKDLAKALGQRKALLLYDTLICNTAMREIMTATHFVNYLEHDRVALNPYEVELLNEKISTPLFKKSVEDLNAVYEKLKNKRITYPQSLKNSDDFAGITDADSLWNKLLEPYRGKVVVVDFWGSWCDPCKRMMTYLQPIEEQLKDQGVVFVYFAYMSPEEPWQNVIKEFDLSGPHVVHYNLPPEQQGLITGKWDIRGFPTYMLIDREGRVVNAHMTFPVNQQKFTDEVREALSK